MAIRLIVHGPSAQLSSPARVFTFDQPRIALGRAASSDVSLPHATVSHVHASIGIDGAHYVLVDEGSTNGTRVDGVRLAPRRPKRLTEGSVLQLGAFAVKIELPVGAPELTDAKAASRAGRALLLDVLASEGKTLRGPYLVLGEAGRELDLESASLPATLGRGASADVRLEGATVAPVHARLLEEADAYLVEAFEGAGGVFLAEKNVPKKRLRSGDELRLGDAVLRFVDPVDDELAVRRAAPDLEGEPELPSTDGLPPPVDAPEATLAEEEAPPPHHAPVWQPKSPPKKGPVSEGPGTSDAVVFMLAGAMIALSLVGLYLLYGDF